MTIANQSLFQRTVVISCFEPGLVDAQVVPSAANLPAAPRIGRAAASLLTQNLEPDDRFAVGSGETTSTTLCFMAPIFPQTKISIVTHTGGGSAHSGTTGRFGSQNSASDPGAAPGLFGRPR